MKVFNLYSGATLHPNTKYPQIQKTTARVYYSGESTDCTFIGFVTYFEAKSKSSRVSSIGTAELKRCEGTYIYSLFTIYIYIIIKFMDDIRLGCR